jgi:dipeptidyl-peptidase 4
MGFKFFFQVSSLCIFLLSVQIINGQDKILTLEDAVLKQRSQLGPKSIQGLQWMPESGAMSIMSDDWKALIKKDDKEEKTILRLDELNNALDLKLVRLPYPDWNDANSFYFSNRNNYYLFNIKTKKGELLYQIPDDAANQDLHKGSAKLAYTIGKNLYYAEKAKAKVQISKIDESTDAVCGQSIARSEFGIRKGTFWSPKGNYLAFYQKNEADVADYPLLDITKTPGQLFSIKYPMAGQKSESAQVGIYNPKDGRTVYLKISGEKDQYLTNLSWDPGEQYIYIAVVNRAQNQMWFNQYNVTDGQFVKTIFEEKHPKYVEPENSAWFLPNNPKEFLWLSERDGFMHLYHYNTDGKLIAQLSKGNWVVESILGLDASGKNLIVSGTDESGLNLHAYSVSLKGNKIEKLTDIEATHYVTLHSDGSKLIDNYSNLNSPRVIRVIDTKNGKETAKLLEAENPLKDYKIGTVELLKLNASDGTLLHARLIKPSNFDPSKKYPVLVYVYGGPHAQMVTNSWLGGAQLWMHYQAERGYLVFTLDNRGSKGRGFEFENIIHRQLGTIEMEDQLKGVEWLKKQPFVDADKMAVHGWSFGGFMTISMMLRNPDVFKVGVAGGPVTDWKYYEVMYGERYMDTPEENPEGYENSKLTKYVTNLKGDLMLIHGTVDDVVLEQHSLTLVKAFVENGIQIDYFPYPMHQHNVLGKDRVHLMRKVLNYIEDKLK